MITLHCLPVRIYNHYETQLYVLSTGIVSRESELMGKTHLKHGGHHSIFIYWRQMLEAEVSRRLAFICFDCRNNVTGCLTFLPSYILLTLMDRIFNLWAQISPSFLSWCVRYLVTVMRKVTNIEKCMPNFCDKSDQIVKALVGGIYKRLALKVSKAPEFYKQSLTGHSCKSLEGQSA